MSTATLTRTTLTPREDRVIAIPLKADAVTKSGIIIPENAQERLQQAEIVSVGPGRWENGELVPMYLNAGERILYARYAGTEVKIDGTEYIILSDKDILAVIE